VITMQVKLLTHMHSIEYHNMSDIISNIKNRNYDAANEILSENITLIMEKKLFEMKKSVAAKMSEQMGIIGPSRAEKLRSDVLEEDEIDEAVDPKEDSLTVERGLPKQKPGSTHYKTTPSNETIVPKNNLKEEESGEESSMARSELNAITKDAKNIMSKVKGNKELEAWTQSKITKAADYLNSVADYMSEEDKKIDMTNKTCTKCHKGKYHETSQHNDMYGVLHCTKCGTQVKRWKVVKEDLDEEQLDEARVKIIKARIRGGKIQRRKKVSNVEGYKVSGGQLQRMSPAERRNRKLGQRRGKIKRRSKMTRTLMKRQKSIRKRTSLGL